MTQSSLYDKILQASNYISNMNNRIYPKSIMEKAIKDLISKQTRIWRILKISKIWNKK
jgi:hypothetical protein